MGLFVFQSNPVRSLEKLVNFGLCAVRSERVKHLSWTFDGALE